MIHHTLLDEDEKDTIICTSCLTREETIVSNGDVGCCTECYSVEHYETAYWGKDGEIYLESEIDWVSA